MTVPEAAMHKHDDLLTPEDEIRFAGKYRIVKTIPVSKTMQTSPHRQLWSGVATANAGHAVRALAGCERVGHVAHTVH